MFAQFFHRVSIPREVPREEENFLSRNPFFRDDDSLTIRDREWRSRPVSRAILRQKERERETRFLRDFFSSSAVVDRLFIHPPRLSHLSHSFNDDSYIFCRVVIAAEDPWDRGDKDSKGALGKTYRILG